MTTLCLLVVPTPAPSIHRMARARSCGLSHLAMKQEVAKIAMFVELRPLGEKKPPIHPEIYSPQITVN